MTKPCRTNAVAQALMLRELHAPDGATVAEIVDATGFATSTVREWLSAFRRQKIVYIKGYEKNPRGADNAPRWAFGLDKRNAQRSRLTGAQRQQRVRDNRKARVASVFHLGAAA
jgi:hypothetical protein